MTKNKNIEQTSNVPFNRMATALWLYENSSLTYSQISYFCHLTEEVVEGIADGVIEVFLAENPIEKGITTQESINKCQEDSNAKLEYSAKYLNFMSEVAMSGKKGRYKYIPVSRRKDKPDAIAWLLKNYPYLTDASIMKLIRTTKSTIESVRSQTHWNAKNIKVRDPVQLNLCSREDLEQIIIQSKTVLERNKMRQTFDEDKIKYQENNLNNSLTQNSQKKTEEQEQNNQDVSHNQG